MEKKKGGGKKSDDSCDHASKGEGEAADSDSPRAEETDEAQVSPVRVKIGEGPDNLRGRGAWYKRRMGGSGGEGR